MAPPESSSAIVIPDIGKPDSTEVPMPFASVT
jgi:hypothetical protein